MKTVYSSPVERHRIGNRPPVSLTAHFVTFKHINPVFHAYLNAYFSMFWRMFACIFLDSSVHEHTHSSYECTYFRTATYGVRLLGLDAEQDCKEAKVALGYFWERGS